MATKARDGDAATGAGNGANGGNGGAKDAAESQAVRVTLIGTSPIRLDPMDEAKILRIVGKVDEEKPPAKSKPEELRAWLVERAKKNLAACTSPDGRYGLPVRYLREALISAGTAVKTGRMSKLSTATKSQVPSLIRIADTFLPFPGRFQAWELDIDHGHGQTGDFAAIFRARFDRWAIQPTLVFDPHRIPDGTVRDLVRLAGLNVGLGGHRPDRKGDGGMFAIGDWEVLTDVPALTGTVDVAALAAELKDESAWTAPAAE